MMMGFILTVLGASGGGTGTVNTFAESVKGSYIVRFVDGTREEEIRAAARQFQDANGGEIVEVMSALLPLAAFTGWDEEAATRVAFDERVLFVDENAIFWPTDTQSLRASPNPSLDRIDQRQNLLDGRFRFPHDGANLLVYIVDSGVSTNNTSFRLRVDTANSATFVGGTATTDNTGHGTAMASLVAGTQVGVAKGATIRSVRIVDSGAINLLLLDQGLNWLATKEPGIVNLSLEATTAASQTSIDDAVLNLHRLGFYVVSSAGNDNSDTTLIVPARVPTILTVGAMVATTGARYVDSNWGPTLDLFAPGADVPSESPGGTVLQGSGTSPAAALTSGALAALLQAGTVSPDTAYSLLVNASTPDAITSGLNGSPNRLLFSDVKPSLTGSANDIGEGLWVYCTLGVGGWRQLVTAVTASTVDTSGNTYIAYRSSEPYGCNTWNPFATPSKTYVEKRTSTGAPAWTVTLTTGPALSERISRILVGPNEDIYMVGSTTDCGGLACPTVDAYVARLSSSTGVRSWLTRLDSGSTDWGLGLVVATNGQSLVAVGSTLGAFPNRVNQGSYDGFAVRISALGTFDLAGMAQFGTSGSETANDVAVLGTAYVVGGSTTGVFPGAVGAGGADGVLATVIEQQPTGSLFFVGANQFGTAGADEVTAVVGSTEVLTQGSVAVLFAVGRTTGAFPGGFANAGQNDIFYARFDDFPSNRQWLFQTGTASDESAPSIARSRSRDQRS